MGGNWQKFRLGDITEWTSGGTPSKSKEDYWGGNIPWISATSMDGNRYRDSDLKITPLGLENGSRLAPKDSILILVRGSILHQKIRVGIAECNVAFNQDVKALRVKNNIIEPWFLLLWFMAKKQELLEIVEYTGIGAGKLDSKILQDFIVDIPPKEERARILTFAKALDDKIELNRQMNATLEGIAQALFKSWFVDFDPVIDNALAAGNPIPEPFQARAAARQALGDKRKLLPPEIQKLFGDRFVFNEDLGWIPEGWEAVKLSDLATKISKGTTPRKSDIPANETFSNVPFIKVKDITDDGQILFDKLSRIPRSVHEGVLKRSILNGGDILFSIAGTIGRCTILPEELSDANTNQAVAFVRPKSEIMAYLILQFLKSKTIQEIVESRLVQAVQANFSLTELGGLTLTLPNDKILKCWDQITRPKLKRMDLLAVENRGLTLLRDTLLPKLLSGQIRIPDAEALVAEAI
ncbi:restriction endonuclease subunit S [Synechocystis salina LEGE 06099]|uniref:restriction endonuclease subunit S n=1 Tax=Synechocystis salina TaxID=945780 RepID=UPI00187FD471|nr:restriction endonuclease subunit S [Synechocystis salina]MBE9202866.1 restriction endonuclease subunit S [Synechocystis salina LEGE 06099]